MIRIRKLKNIYPELGDGWLVTSDKYKSGDIVSTFWDAIKYALWYMGVPFRWLYRKK